LNRRDCSPVPPLIRTRQALQTASEGGGIYAKDSRSCRVSGWSVWAGYTQRRRLRSVEGAFPDRSMVPMTSMPLVHLAALIDDAKCFALIRQQRWPDGVRCP